MTFAPLTMRKYATKNGRQQYKAVATTAENNNDDDVDA